MISPANYTYGDDLSKLVNFALNKQCEQSSAMSPVEMTPGRAVDGVQRKAHAFHTAREAHPWWQVDLGVAVPLQMVALFNVGGKYSYRAARCTVKVSGDGATWQEVYSAVNVFGGHEDGRPLVLRLLGMVSARFVRVQLVGRTYLHMSQVEIYVKQADADLATALACRGIDALGFFDGARLPYAAMELKSPSKPKIEALHVIRFGRFGNCVISLSNALAVAEYIGIEKIFLNTSRLMHEEFDLGARVLDGKFKVLPDDAAQLENRTVLAGTFFSIDAFPAVKQSLSPDRRRALVQQHVLPRLNSSLRNAKPLDKSNVVVHFRSGDIFSGINAPSYRQPPLEYYKMALAGAIENGCTNVMVVFEDRSNPVIDPFLDFCAENGIKAQTFESGFLQDLGLLMSAASVICPRSTLTEALFMLSIGMKFVWIFEEPAMAELASSVGIRCFHIRDRAGEYIKVKDWKNTEEQYQQMLAYPKGSLKLERR